MFGFLDSSIVFKNVAIVKTGFWKGRFGLVMEAGVNSAPGATYDVATDAIKRIYFLDLNNPGQGFKFEHEHEAEIDKAKLFSVQRGPLLGHSSCLTVYFAEL